MKNFVILLSICLPGIFFVPSPGTGTVVDFTDPYGLCAFSCSGCDAPIPVEKSEIATGSAAVKASCREDNDHHNKHFRLAAARAHVVAAQASMRLSAVLAATHSLSPGLGRLYRLNI